MTWPKSLTLFPWVRVSKQDAPVGQVKRRTWFTNLSPLFVWNASPAIIITSTISIGGVIDASFTVNTLPGYRVVGDITSTFVTGGDITVGGKFTHTGLVQGTYSVSAVVGYRVDGEVTATFLRRAGQLADCISGSGEASGGNPPNAVH